MKNYLNAGDWSMASCYTTQPLRRRLDSCRLDSTRQSVCNTPRGNHQSDSCEVLSESNELLRGKLKTAEQTIAFVSGKLKVSEEELRTLRENSAIKDQLIRELT